jgi:hypothetical protein
MLTDPGRVMLAEGQDPCLGSDCIIFLCFFAAWSGSCSGRMLTDQGQAIARCSLTLAGSGSGPRGQWQGHARGHVQSHAAGSGSSPCSIFMLMPHALAGSCRVMSLESTVACSTVAPLLLPTVE